MDDQQNESKPIHPESIRNRIVVFDIDDTLCIHNVWENSPEDLLFINNHHPECLIIDEYIFLPHLQILFEYLLKHEVRVVFFSAACKKRNETLIPALLTSFWGAEKYEALRAKGQFTIFSDVDCRKGTHRKEGEGNLVKDLKVVIRDGESLSDVILVDDDRSYVAYDQHPFVRPLDLMRWFLRSPERNVYKYSKNGVYYLLGLFKTAFENEEYKELALKEAFRQILPENYYPTDKIDSFKRNMMDIGLAEVQKQIPGANFFGAPSSPNENYDSA